MIEGAPFVQFEFVSKKFRKGQTHDSLRDLVPAAFRRIVGKPPAPGGAKSREFWALREVSFLVEPGEVLGIIGPNGAGKSTALKILNQILEPSEGNVRVQGRVGALIEVAAGFHQDLSGRQNVFLQGAIMGMRRREIESKFDAIVEFSGISEFIDTPVKRYSSGMNARLGFAVAAHLDPDVLLIDEVLAVGDHAFQKKAFGRIMDMSRAGAPVVLVSHQLDKVKELCTKVVLLERGTVRHAGTPAECINVYLNALEVGVNENRYGDAGFSFEPIEVVGDSSVPSGDEIVVLMKGQVTKALTNPAWVIALRVLDMTTGETVHSVTGRDRGIPIPGPGVFRHELRLQMNLRPGLYQLEATIWDVEGRSDVSTSSRAQVEVLERLKFWGTTQLNSRWSVLT